MLIIAVEGWSKYGIMCAMELYIDTANINEIREAATLGVLDGVTTNPSLVAKEGVDFHDR